MAANEESKDPGQSPPSTPPPEQPPPGGPTPPGGRTSPASPWTLRRAELEWLRLVQEAQLDHHGRVAAALAEYHQALKQAALTMSGEESSALAAAEADSQATGASVERLAGVARRWRERVAEIRGASGRRAMAAAKKLAEDQQRSWLDAVDRQREAYARYLQAVEGAYASAAGNPGPAPTVPGDEGLMMGMSGVMTRPAWAGMYGGWGCGWR